MAVAVEFVGVEKRFGNTIALQNVNFTVNQGEFFAMLGPSGSGKTTCLRLIAGFDFPTQGSIQLEGKIADLKNPLNHYSYENLSDYKIALEKYAKLASTEIKKEKANFPLLRAIWSFIFRYIFRLGFLEGVLGFQLALSYSNYVYRKYHLAKLRFNINTHSDS